MSEIDDIRKTIADLRLGYRDTIDRVFRDQADDMIELCRSSARNLGQYIEAGATYGEGTLIITQVIASTINTASENNLMLRMALAMSPQMMTTLACALAYFTVTPQEITG